MLRNRAALAKDPTYDDRVVEQVHGRGVPRERVFSAVDNPNNNTEWTDFSVDCFYVGTFEVGEQAKIDKGEVKRGEWWLPITQPINACSHKTDPADRPSLLANQQLIQTTTHATN